MSIREKLAEIPAVAKISSGLYKAKPTIYVALGMAGTAVSVYLAWRAGKKTKEVMDEVKTDISEVRKLRPADEDDDSAETKVEVLDANGNPVEPLAKRDYNLALAKAYVKAGYKLGKVFAPAVLTEAASLAAIGVGYGILNERHLATVEACNMYAAMLNNYRKRVRQEYGEEKEKQLYFGVQEKEYEEPELNDKGEPKLDKNGKPKVRRTKRQVLEAELAKHSMYARIFDPKNCTEFEYNKVTGEEDVYYNGKSIRDRVKYLNKVMLYQKYSMWTLNEVYKEFGFSGRKYGQVMGWHCSGVDPVTKEFIYDGDPEGIRVELFPVWYEDEEGRMQKTYIIDFNVAGEILGYYPTEDDLD